MVFIDEARVHAFAWRGGNGCVAFRREKFVPHGGPAGGDGGHGGSVVLVGDGSINTLFHLRHSRHLRAERGQHGEGSNRTGRCGADTEVMVPLGTIVQDATDGSVLGEVLEDRERLVVARGGRGGKGNARFASATRQAPDFAQDGREGGEIELVLELKLLADVGLVGLPNAGKSTLISVVSAARPKVADYPFTTLVPQLGVVAVDPLREPCVIADLPGLIEGAAQGAGLGHQFLRHVERCRVLVHLVDLAQVGESPVSQVVTVEEELGSFNTELLDRPRMLVGTKVDAAIESRSSELRSLARRRGLAYFEISSVTRSGVDVLVAAIESSLLAEPRRSEGDLP